MTSILRRGEDTETRGKRLCNGSGRELCCHKPREARNARNHHKVEDAKNFHFGEILALPTPWFRLLTSRTVTKEIALVLNPHYIFYISLVCITTFESLVLILVAPSGLSSCSVQFSRSVVSDSLQLHGLQHTRLPCPSQTPRACSDSCPLSQWRHPNISPSGIPFSSCLHLSQYQGLLQWVSSLHQLSKVLEFQVHHQFF